MTALSYQPNDLLPGISFNKESGKFKIYGVSCPENAFEFYEPLFKWFDEYQLNPLRNTVLDFNLEYFNTSTAKFLYIFMSKLENLSDSEHEVKIRWHYDVYDEDMKEEGEEFENIVDVNFEFIPLKSEKNDMEEEDDNNFFNSLLDSTNLN